MHSGNLLCCRTLPTTTLLTVRRFQVFGEGEQFEFAEYVGVFSSAERLSKIDHSSFGKIADAYFATILGLYLIKAMDIGPSM